MSYITPDEFSIFTVFHFGMVHSLSLALLLVMFCYCVAVREIKCNLWQGKCPPGWKTFVRPPGIRICLRIFNQNATYLEAQNVCRRHHNSRIHGVANVEEQSWVKMKARKLISENPGFLWLGARRKSFCYKVQADLARDEKCNKKTDVFEWDDQITDNKFMFTQWDTTIDAPNGILSNGAPEDCAAMNVNENPGYIDDKDCSLPQSGFLCGMTA